MTDGGRIRITLEDLGQGGRSIPAPGAGAPQTPKVSFGQGNIDHDLPSVMKANRLLAGRNCSLCHSAIEAGQDVRNCEECRLSYHLECWKSNAGCGTYGCPSSPDARQNPVRHVAPLPLQFPPATFSQKMPAGGFQQINQREPVQYGTQTMSGNSESSNNTAIVLGYVMAVVIPIIGVILSFYLLAKGRIGHFVGVLALSIFMTYFWFGFWSAFWEGFVRGVQGD